MTYCSNCGHQIPDNAKFCENCGTNISGGNTKFQHKSDSTEKNKSNTKWYILGGVALFIFALIIIGSSDTDYYEDDTLYEDSSTSTSQTIMATCPYCGGTGIQENMGNDIFFPSATCYACNGSGLMEQEAARKAQNAINQFNNSIYGRGSSSGSEGSKPNTRDYHVCWNCHGSGKCSACAGRGERRYEGNYGQPGSIMDCTFCHGSGRCQVCYGRGRTD